VCPSSSDTPMSSDKVTLTEQQSHEGDNAGTLSEADRIVRKLGLQEHEEGGWFRECYFETEVTTAEGRPCGSSILFLLKAGERSHWHRLDATEIWHYHAGAPLLLSVASNEEGPVTEYRLGPDILGGDLPQARVPSRHWQTARSLGAWTLVGCTVTPGFSYKGFELAPKEFDIPR